MQQAARTGQFKTTAQMKRARISSLASDTAALSLEDHPEHTSAKYPALEHAATPTTAIQCSLPPHEPLDFPNISSYEGHYLSAHSHRCSECYNNFPSAHFLDLHITELHDPICQAREATGQKIYACFVEGCEKVCIDWKRRRSHLVDKHGFPRNYDFFVVRDGIDGRRSLLRYGIDEQGHRKSSREREAQHDTHDEDDDSPGLTGVSVADRSGARDASSCEESVDSVISSLSAMNMVPRSLTFGRRKGKAGFSKT